MSRSPPPARRARPALLLGLLAACGTLDPPPLDPLFDPGKGPFRDQNAVEVCLGSARLVSGGSGVVGVCVAAGTAETPCSSEADCSHGEACLCGRCAVEGCLPGSVCRGGRLCSHGRCSVSCQSNAGCAPGETCSDGVCTSICAADADCGFGGSCDKLSGTCSARACSDDASCGAGRGCSLEERAADAREPAWADLASGPAVYLEVREGAVRSVYRATREADQRLRLSPSPVLQGAGAPSPLVRGGELAALFAESNDGASIVVARPDDPTGAAFSAPPSAALSPAAPWEQGRVASPAVVSFQGADWLFYEGGTGAGIGLARLDSVTLVGERQPGPVLAPSQVEDPLLWRGITSLGAPDALVQGDLLSLYFSARGAVGSSAVSSGSLTPAPPTDSIGLAVSSDLTRFDLAPEGPVFARRTNLRTYLGEREPAVLLSAGPPLLLYVATDAAGHLAGLSLATSP